MGKEMKSLRKTGKFAAGALGPLLPLVLLLNLFFAGPVWAVPMMPYQIYGNLTIDGTFAAGKNITAIINGNTVGQTITDGQGKYGYSPNFFRIPAADSNTPGSTGGVDGDTVQLYVLDKVAGTAVFASGNIVNLDLAVTSTPAPAPSAPPVTLVPTQSPAPTQAPAPVPPPAPTIPEPALATKAPAPAPTQASAPVSQTPTPMQSPIPIPVQTQPPVPSVTQEAQLAPATTQPTPANATPDSAGFKLSLPVVGGGGLILIVIVVMLYSLLHRSKL